tara:strand:- start:257 stop:721 length:465 start_codon:yes stop_codon:yes gene_type:complete
MESVNSASGEAETTINENQTPHLDPSDQWFNERFETLLPRIQEQWPDMAKQTLEATRGSIDELVRVIASHSGKTPYGVKTQLEELFESASDQTRNFAESLEPLEKQLEDILDDLNKTLRPRIEKPVREKPLLAIGLAAGIGIIFGIILSGGRRS